MLILTLAVPAGLAREIHVATTGQDAAPGTREQPLRTISRAAQLAQPGDVVTVQAGTYREWVKPARGGTSENQRMIYRTAPNEKVVIKGSERMTRWTEVGGGVWKVELPNSFFGDDNPYALNLSGGWLNFAGQLQRIRTGSALSRTGFISLQIAKNYLAVGDPDSSKRTWSDVAEQILKTKSGENGSRWRRVWNDRAFEPLRKLKIVDTNVDHFTSLPRPAASESAVVVVRAVSFQPCLATTRPISPAACISSSPSLSVRSPAALRPGSRG